MKAIPPPPLATYDALLEVRGQLCTEPPEEVVFPVKVLFALDQSASLQCTDAQNRRFAAIGQLISDLRSQPNTSFGFVGFSSWSRELGFTRDQTAIDAFIDPSGGLGPATDYQGALATVLRILETDMLDIGAAERARTRYVVVFVSDGVAEPRCQAGCEDDVTACSDNRDNDGDGLPDMSDPDCVGVGDNSTHPDSLYGVCNTTQTVPDDVYVDFDGLCPAYNQPEQILQRVAELDFLADLYAVGDIRMDAVLLFSPQAEVEAVCPGASASFGYNGDQARALLQQMAEAGGGTFRDVNLATSQNDFFRFDFGSLQSRQWLVELVAANVNARLVGGERRPDSDADGLDDTTEAMVGTRDDTAESDGGDNYTDLFELRWRAAGFDANDAALPAARCDDTGDFDGDGLTNCEERFLETGRRDPDSDRDGLIDWLEVVAGTDPTVDDAGRDIDFDGVLNRDEIRGATDPLVPDADRYRDERVRYTLTDLGDLDVPDASGDLETRHCYSFGVSRIPLVTPLHARERGLNRIMLYSLERPVALAGAEARTHVACVEARYEGPTSKDPVDGLIDLRPNAWSQRLADLERPRDDVRLCNAENITVDDYRRGDLEALMTTCLPPRVELDGFLYRQEALRALLSRHLDNRLRLRLPAESSRMFVPIESFDADADCLRPGELATVKALLHRVATECAPCDAGPGE